MEILMVGGAMIDTIAIIDSDRIERMTMLNADSSSGGRRAMPLAVFPEMYRCFMLHRERGDLFDLFGISALGSCNAASRRTLRPTSRVNHSTREARFRIHFKK